MATRRAPSALSPISQTPCPRQIIQQARIERAFKIRRERLPAQNTNRLENHAGLGRNCDFDLPLQADEVSVAGDVRFVPNAEISICPQRA
jgi:hypothetical protein